MSIPVLEPRSGRPPRGGRGRRRLTLDRLPRPVFWGLVAVVVLAACVGVTAPVWSGGPATPNERTEAVLRETRDPADPSRVTGRFDVTLAVLGETGTRPGPQNAAIAGALAWAGARSPRVDVVAGDGQHYSAGDIALPGMPSLPTTGRTFRPRFAYEPASGALPRAWWVRLTFDSTYPKAPAIAEQIGPRTQELRVESDGDTRVIDIRLPARRDGSVLAQAHRLTGLLEGDSATSVFSRQLGTVASAGDSGIRVTLAGSGRDPAVASAFNPAPTG